jgi:hypothetical protein
MLVSITNGQPALRQIILKELRQLSLKMTVQAGADLCIALHRSFETSKGTKDCVHLALVAGIPVYLIEEEQAIPTWIGGGDTRQTWLENPPRFPPDGQSIGPPGSAGTSTLSRTWLTLIYSARDNREIEPAVFLLDHDITEHTAQAREGWRAPARSGSTCRPHGPGARGVEMPRHARVKCGTVVSFRVENGKTGSSHPSITDP